MGEILCVLAIGLLFIGLGLAISRYKCYWLISGYNTASKKEKEKVDIDSLAKHMGRLCYLITFTIWITAFLVYSFKISMNIPIVFMVIVIFAYVSYMQRFDNNEASRMDKEIIYFIGGVVLVILILVFSFGHSPNEINVSEGKIIIRGSYGITIKNENINSIELIESMPKIEFKSNGYSNGPEKKKGEFKLEGGRISNLYIESKEGPYIKITLDKYDVYINNKDKELTKNIYKLLNSKLNNL